MKRLLHVIDTLQIGGAEKLLTGVINRLNGKYEQYLVLLNRPDTLLHEIEVIQEVKVLHFRSYKDLFITGRQLRRFIKDRQIQIVHSHLYWSNIVARMARPSGVKLINTIHAISSEASYKINKASYYLEKLTYGKNTHLVTVSREVLTDFDKWIGVKGPAQVIYNMIEDRFVQAVPKSAVSQQGLKLVSVGNLRWQKNYEYLLEAFIHLPPHVSLDIYGEGALRPKLQAYIDQKKINVRLMGHHHNLQQLLPGYDFLVMSSFYEGFSLGLMEAMALGLPALLSDIPVLREAGDDTALYFNIDNPQHFVDLIQRIMTNDYNWHELSRRARERAILLTSPQKHIGSLISIYEHK